MTGLLPDITINTGSEFGVSGIVGNTDAGVEFIDENGGGPGVRLRKKSRAR